MKVIRDHAETPSIRGWQRDFLSYLPAMRTIHAIYSNGVFQPLEHVDLPEASEVEFEPRAVRPSLPAEREEHLPLSPVALEVERLVQPENTGPDEA